MNKVRIEEVTEITVKGIYGFIKRGVTKFGLGPKVDSLKEFLSRRVYLIITRDEVWRPKLAFWKITLYNIIIINKEVLKNDWSSC
ncbi:MAG: DUF2080 family transposase-associated protein [Candidatus Micrarchaeaceae archaeon]